MTTVPAPVMSHPVDQGRGEVRQPGPDPLDELVEAVRLAVQNMEYLADRHQAEGYPEPEPGQQYRPADYGTMTGKLVCKLCDRPIREHGLGEWH